MKITDRPLPTMTRDEMADDYPRLKREYTLLHEDYRRLQAEKDRQFAIHDVFVPKGTLCECECSLDPYKR